MLMKFPFLVWLFLLVGCATAMTATTLGGTPGSTQHEVQGLNRAVGISNREGDARESMGEKQEMVYSKKSHSGKGSTGGGNIAHKPPRVRSPASLSAKPPPLFVSATVLCVGFGFDSLLTPLVSF